MGNENERKRDPAENREREMGHPYDEVKMAGGGEKNVGQTGDTAGAGEGQGAGTVGVVGGSPTFLAGESDVGGGEPASPSGQTGQQSFGNQQNLTDRQGGDQNFGGDSGAGSSAIAGNTGQSDLGSAGVGQPGLQSGDRQEFGQTGGQSATGETSRSGGAVPLNEGTEPDLGGDEVGPGGYSPESGASDLGGGETGLGDVGGREGSAFIAGQTDESGEYLQRSGNPDSGFAEQGRGAPDQGDVERGTERTANRDSDIEGSSQT